MTRTPWGDVRDLSTRKLPPGPGKSRDLVHRSQRDRLLAAMVASVAERGYRATRVADVVALAGVSRSTFYRHFEDRLDCVLQALEAIASATEDTLTAALEGEGTWDDRLRACLRRLAEIVADQPAAARLCLVEAYSAGPEAAAHVDRMARRVGRQVLAVLEESPDHSGMPRDIARAVLGGLRRVVQSRVHASREQELPVLMPQLAEWALSYRTPPQPLAAGPQPSAETNGKGPARSQPRERIIDGIVAIAARQSLSTTTVNEIATEASTSLSTFYDRFDGKESAYAATLDEVLRHLFEVMLPAYRGADDWPHGVRAAVEMLFGHLSSEPAAARFVAEALWASPPTTLTHLEGGMASFQALLAEGLDQSRTADSHVAAEAIGASILALAYGDVERAAGGRLYELAPVATYVALSPSVGADDACALANGG